MSHSCNLTLVGLHKPWSHVLSSKTDTNVFIWSHGIPVDLVHSLHDKLQDLVLLLRHKAVARILANESTAFKSAIGWKLATASYRSSKTGPRFAISKYHFPTHICIIYHFERISPPPVLNKSGNRILGWCVSFAISNLRAMFCRGQSKGSVGILMCVMEHM